MDPTTERRALIEKYIEAHAKTDDFLFQQQLRGLELTIKKVANKTLGEKKAESFIISGWGLVIGAAHLLQKTEGQLKISNAYKQMLQKDIEEILSKDNKTKTHFLLKDVLGKSNNFITHKEVEGLGFKPVTVGNTIETLNGLVPQFELKFTLNKKARIYLEIDPEFFNALWKTDFPKSLVENGFIGLEKNMECPHVTLIGSGQINKIKNKCEALYGQKWKEHFNAFISTTLNTINSQIKQQEKPVSFVKLSTKYTENYSPFEEIIVAYLNSPTVTQAMQLFASEVEKQFQFKINVTQPQNYHVTIAIKPREAEVLADGTTMESLISKTGQYATGLSSFWKGIPQKV